jgi:hypothetical protein
MTTPAAPRTYRRLPFDGRQLRIGRQLPTARQAARAVFCCAIGLAVGAQAAESTAAVCAARSSAAAATVVELYTSEGCSSCPPADRWLSNLKTAQPGVIAMAFHVDYWDRLGWRDAFGNAAYSARQAQQLAVNGAAFSYTPQVVVNGIDAPDWRVVRPAAFAAAQPAAGSTVQVQLSRDREQYVAVVQAGAGTPRLAAYWAVTEHQHASDIKAGENRGATLSHDFVVTDYRAVPAWQAAAGASTTLGFSPLRPASATHPRQVNLVVTDAASGRPVQAVKLGC